MIQSDKVYQPIKQMIIVLQFTKPNTGGGDASLPSRSFMSVYFARDRP